MGRITLPFGVSGWVKVATYTEHLDSLLDYPVWWMGGGSDFGATRIDEATPSRLAWHATKVIESKVQGDTLIVHLEGCDDRNAALKLKGLQVAVPRSQFAPSPKGEYYWADLIGLSVFNLQDEMLGKVSGLLETGANDVLEVSDIGRQRLLPFVGAVIREVDIAAGWIKVDWQVDW